MGQTEKLTAGRWSAIQTLLERSLSDVLILLDCCAGAASATFPHGNSITETISASSWDAIAPDPGRYSFTNALIEVLQEWNRRSFSAAMLHAEVLARLKHPRPIMLNGKHFEARSTPVHFMMTANHKAPSIEMSRVMSSDQMPPSPPQEPAHEESAITGRTTGPEEIIGSEPNEDVPHVMISLALEDDQRLNINDWEHWLQSIPAIAKYVKVQGVFKSHSTLLLLSMPVMVWDLLPDDRACNFVAFVRSNNLAMQSHPEPTSIEDELQLRRDIDAESRFSIFSGTTAYTSAALDTEILGDRRTTLRSSMASNKDYERWKYADAPHSRQQGPVSPTLPPEFTQEHDSGSLASLSRQKSAPPKVLNKKASLETFSKMPVLRQRSNRPSTKVSDLHGRPELAPHVQARLESYFLDNPRPTLAVKEFLASNLGIETSDIDVSIRLLSAG
jgi:hypothetical protein